nr:MAG TPA: hypothetical protein [Caudoviricetes sp.]
MNTRLVTYSQKLLNCCQSLNCKSHFNNRHHT